jgi:translation initiation factor IF-2
MSKKRVHEIAKELKDSHQIELDNKAVVTELVSLGYDVKSHSSSLEDDQAVEAVRRIVEKRKPKAPPAPVAPKGFVVRRKVGETVQSTVMAPAAHGQLPAAPPAPSAPAAETPAVELAPPPALADTAEIAAPAPLPPADAPAAVAAAPSAPRAAPPVEPEVSAVPAPVAP